MCHWIKKSILRHRNFLVPRVPTLVFCFSALSNSYFWRGDTFTFAKGTLSDIRARASDREQRRERRWPKGENFCSSVYFSNLGNPSLYTPTDPFRGVPDDLNMHSSHSLLTVLHLYAAVTEVVSVVDDNNAHLRRKDESITSSQRTGNDRIMTTKEVHTRMPIVSQAANNFNCIVS